MNIAMNFNQASHVASDLSNERRKLNSYSSSIRSVIRQCPLSGKTRAALALSLNKLAKGIDQECIELGNMQNALNASIQMYHMCERNLTRCEKSSSMNWETNGTGTHRSGGGGGRSIDSASHGSFSWGTKDWAKVIGGFGIVGNILGTCMLWNKDTDKFKFAIDALKNGAKAVGGIATAVGAGGTSTAWKEALFGTGTAFKDIDTSSVGKTFVSSWNKQFGKDLGLDDIGGASVTTASKVKIATKWAGHALTVVGNAYENYQEMDKKGISLERAVNETVVESAVDIAVGAAATAASTAVVGAAAGALAAAGATALAPVIGSAAVVAAGAVAITWAANGICKWATGKFGGEEKDLGELAADTVCDLGEKAEAFRSAVVSSSVEIAKNVGKSIQEGLSTKWNRVCSIFA